MNLRTITFWVIYDPKQKRTLAERRTKKEIVGRIHIREGCVLVKMKGHYLPPRRTPDRTVPKKQRPIDLSKGFYSSEEG